VKSTIRRNSFPAWLSISAIGLVIFLNFISWFFKEETCPEVCETPLDELGIQSSQD